MVTLYLDSNVVIGAGKRREHSDLKSLAVADRVCLYWSPTGQHEHRARSIEASKQSIADDPALARAEFRRREEVEASEEQEREWWRPAVLHYPHCTFEGLILNVGLADLLADPTGELGKLADLLDNHGIRRNDAIHLMIAHSAKLDRLLTWDEDLIKKARRVTWVRPTVETPAQFLAHLPS